MSSHRLLTAAAAKLGISAAAPAIAAAGAPAASSEDPVDVVTHADAVAAIAAAEARGMEAGATAERTRTAAVLGSAPAQANFAMAAFMLEQNPAASADVLIANLGKMPAAAAVTTPAPAAEAAPAITTPLAQTPKVDIAPNANLGTDAGKTKADVDKSWDTVTAEVNASSTVGELAPGIPRTGN